ncbi:MAG: hypothetical protein HRU31_16405 [Rhodobacteraceae bacterium]|nr:hypothetical protein [Paracoccaceae bacterium]
MTGARAYLGTMIFALLLAGMGLYLLLSPTDGRVELTAEGIAWKVQQIGWIEQDGFWRAEADVRAIDITRATPIDRTLLLQAVCMALLGSGFVPARHGFDLAGVYRVDLSLAAVSGDRLMSDHALPVPVRNGTCMAPLEDIKLTYAGPISGWHLDLLSPVITGTDQIQPGGFEVTFLPIDPAADPDWDAQFACEAALRDGIVVSNIHRLVPQPRTTTADELDPAITETLGWFVDELLALLPGTGWRVARHVHRAGDPNDAAAFDVQELRVIAIGADTRMTDSFAVTGTRCDPMGRAA